MLYWLPELHKSPFKSRLSTNSSSCTTPGLSITLTTGLTTIKNHVVKYCETVLREMVKSLFWPLKNFGEILNNLKS